MNITAANIHSSNATLPYINNNYLRTLPYNSNTTVENYPRALPYSNEFRITLLLLYGIVFVFGLLGNLMTCVAVITVRTMRRSIHFYIFNLAVADLLLLFLYVPTQMVFVRDYMSWEMGKDMCVVAFGIICLCLTASIGTLVSISVDRYKGILRPFDWRAASTRNAKIVIPLIWLCSAGIAAPLSYHGNVGQNRDGSNVCYENWSIRDMVIYWSTIMVVQYILPLIFITVVHLHMAFIVSRQKQQDINELHKRMIRMVIMLLFTYSICNGMQHINFYLSIYMNVHTKWFGSYLFLFSNFAISLQAAINPLIYGISRNDYKNVFKFFLSSYASKILKLLKCSTSIDERSKSHQQLSSNESERTMTESVALETPSLFKKDNAASMDATSQRQQPITNSAILGIGEAILVNEARFTTTTQLLSIPTAQRRKKVSVSESVSRSDTMYYTTKHNGDDVDKKRSMRRKNRKAKTKNQNGEDLANQMVSQIVTSNQNHPIIVVTDHENQNGDPSGRYGTIVERDCLELTTPNLNIKNHKDNYNTNTNSNENCSNNIKNNSNINNIYNSTINKNTKSINHNTHNSNNTNRSCYTNLNDNNTHTTDNTKNNRDSCDNNFSKNNNRDQTEKIYNNKALGNANIANNFFNRYHFKNARNSDSNNKSIDDKIKHSNTPNVHYHTVDEYPTTNGNDIEQIFFKNSEDNNKSSSDNIKHLNTSNILHETVDIHPPATNGNNLNQLLFRRNLFLPYPREGVVRDSFKNTTSRTVKNPVSKRSLFSSPNQKKLVSINPNSNERILPKRNLLSSLNHQETFNTLNHNIEFTNKDDVWLFRNYPESLISELLNSSLESTI